MGKLITTDAANCIDCYREELLIYLVQRFGSLGFARRVFDETQSRLADSNILDCVSNPHIYLISYALSVGLELMQTDTINRKQTPSIESVSNVISHHAQQTTMIGGESWHSQPISILH